MLEFGIWNFGFRVLNLDFGIWNLEFGIWKFVFLFLSHKSSESTVSYSQDCLPKGLPTRPTRSVPYRPVPY